MKFASRYLVAAALVAAPLHAAAQTTPPPAPGEHARAARGPHGPGMGSPVERLLSHREQLGLTDAQVSRLQAIDRDLQARNAPLRQQLAAILPEMAQRAERAREAGPRAERRPRGERPERPRLTDEQREQMRQRREQARPIMQQLRENMRTAMAEARAVLTPEQQQRVRSRMEQHRGERGEGRGMMRGPRQRGANPPR